MILKSQLETILNENIRGYFPTTGKLQTESGKSYFLKSGSPSRIYQCEANGLNELRKANAIGVAEVIAATDTFILTKFIERGSCRTDFHADFGRQFATMHRYQSEHFGFFEDNFIGANPQLNCATDDEKNNWPAFYFNKRLLYQFKLAEQNGYVSSRLRQHFSILESKIERILEGSEEAPTLLHGDLWPGNYISNEQGSVVLIDPAVYYGHREADLAMTKLFGGFSPAFYAAYQEENPLPDGWQYRENIYKLYHLLNHLNLFGRSYLPEVESMVFS